MDELTHHNYNYLLLRANSICSVVKQDQFRASVEITINKLFDTSQAQYDALVDSLSTQRVLIERNRAHTLEESEAHLATLAKLREFTDIINQNIEILVHNVDLRKLSESKLIDFEKTINSISDKLEHNSIQILSNRDQFIQDIVSEEKEIFIHIQKLKNEVERLSFAVAELSRVRDEKIQHSLESAIPHSLNFAYLLSVLLIIRLSTTRSNFTIRAKTIIFLAFIINSSSIMNDPTKNLTGFNFFLWLSYFFLEFTKFTITQLYTRFSSNKKISLRSTMRG